MEKPYQGKWSAETLADYCWKLKTNLDAKYYRKSYQLQYSTVNNIYASLHDFCIFHDHKETGKDNTQQTTNKEVSNFLTCVIILKQFSF